MTENNLQSMNKIGAKMLGESPCLAVGSVWVCVYV